ncbi:molybdenum cofactor guanylyltransferase [Marinicaulis aureus]|uniref:Molybdenum cofactor guanylyltransferase n=1 Tax=Hyphococcus aureus TaxID=2666033 RepID=A0ABW1KXM3_9PROT
MPQVNETPKKKTDRVAVILAGGGGRRMGGADKGALMLGGRRLVDHVLARLAPQTDRILISGRHDYGTGLPVLRDRDDGPLGPAAGLWAALKWIEQNNLATNGFLSAPVDGPFIPDNLFERLSGGIGSAIACDATGVQPAFAYWRCDQLHGALAAAPEQYGFPLKELADSLHAERVMFESADAFLNINSPEDLARAEAITRR